MKELMQDPVFYWLMWAIFTVVGTILGWSLRGNTSEKEVRNTLVRVEQEKNTLARLYTHLKHQHDLREADYRRATIEVNTLRDQLQGLEDLRRQYEYADRQYAARIAKAEQHAQMYAQKVTALEILNNNLQAKHTAQSEALAKMEQEVDAWQVLYRDFQQMQQRMNGLSAEALVLEKERDEFREQLADARADVERLQKELIQQQLLAQKDRKPQSARGKKGGPAAPEVKDDLKLITGIDATMEGRLNAMHVYTYEQIGAWDDDTVIAMSKALNISPGRIFKEDWPGQARHLDGLVQR